MLPKLLTQIFGSRNDRLLKGYRRTVDQINQLEATYSKLDDAAPVSYTHLTLPTKRIV